MSRRPPALRGKLSRRLLVISASCGQLAFLLVHSKVSAFRLELGTTFGWLLALVAITIPYASVRIFKHLRDERGIELKKARRIFVLEWLPLLFARVDTPSLFLLVSLAILTSHALARPRHDAISTWAMAGGLTLTLIGAATVPSGHWLWLVPLALITLGAALVLLHVNRGLAQRDSLKRWSFMSNVVSSEDLPRPARLALYGLPFALLTVLCIPVFSVGIISIPTPFSETRRLASGRAAALDVNRTEDSAATAARMAFRGIFPSNVAFGRGVDRLRHATVMLITPPEGVSDGAFRSAAPYYIRGLVQDRFSETGAGYSGGAALREYAANRQGWITLSEGEPALELNIYQQPLLTRQGTWNILFSPQPALAVHAERVQFDPDGVLVSLDGSAEWKHYAVRAGLDDARLFDLKERRAKHDDPRYTQLPPASRELAQVEREAQRITAGAATDEQRVNAIIGHFHKNFLYTLRSQDTPGLAGVLNFLEQREGHCTDYAAASALLLRTIGIPARIATGFLANEWSEDEQAFIVTTRQGHAWLEVYFENVGWLRYEPTPSERRDRALRAAEYDPDAGLLVWFSDLGSDFTYWAASGMDERNLELWAGTLTSGPRALISSFERQPLVFLGWLAALIAGWFTATRFAFKRAARVGSRARKRVSPELDSYTAILQALAKLGHRKSVAQTPREFAKQVVAASPEWAELVPVTELLYRVQFGGVSLNQDERRFVQKLANLQQPN